MRKEKYNTIFIIVILLALIIISFIFTYLSSKKYNSKINNIKDKVLTYLEEKYHEDFNIENFSINTNYYETVIDNEVLSNPIPSSYIYNIELSSRRLIEFNVVYVDYEDESEYEKYKNYNILEEGIYDNYIYEYKIRDIKSEIKNDILSKFDLSSNLKVEINNISTIISEDNNIIINYSMDSDDLKELNNKYLSFNKTVSNREYYETCLGFNSQNYLTINLDINKHIDKNNLDEFEEEIKEVVIFLQDLGYIKYDININLNNYQTARIIPYSEEDLNDAYLMFDYGIATSVEYDEQLSSYLIKINRK